MTHDYAATERDFEACIKFLKSKGWPSVKDFADLSDDSIETIIHALRFAEKMMQEPSEGMCDAGYGTKLSDTYINDLFKAMRDQALKELGE